jgi:dipeptidyl aminopeptidase/acylaminoacyl peptidase
MMVAAALAVAVGPAAGQPASSIDRAAWLAGCWELRATNRLTMEMWMPPFGGMMMGASRTTIGGVSREFEHLRLSARGDTLIYTAVPSGQRETDFRSTLVSADRIVFENRAHDFPQVIIYRRAGADSVIARIEGPGANNAVRGIDFPMRRVSCTDRIAPPPPPDTAIIDADLSPDGQTLLVVRNALNNWDVFAQRPDGGNVRRLTDHTAVDYQAVWSPDGSRIAFASVRDGHQEIYTMMPDGSALTRLTTGTAHNSEPAWSPDGRSIAFRSERDGRPQVWVMSADGSAQRALTRDSAGAASPAWSPDGRMVAFWSTRDGNDEVYVMSADGSNARNITRSSARDTPLAWTRDGDLLFRSTRDRAASDIYRMKPDGSSISRVTTTR